MAQSGRPAVQRMGKGIIKEKGKKGKKEKGKIIGVRLWGFILFRSIMRFISQNLIFSCLEDLWERIRIQVYLPRL